MYEKFFGFQRPPFELVPDPDFLFLGESHDSALANLVVGIESGKGFIAISGPVGTGKTTVLRALLRRLGRSEKVCFLAQPELETGDLLRAILDGFGIVPEGEDVAHLRRALRETMHSSDVPGILIIDEAHLLSVDALEQIRLLSNLEEDDRKLLQIILSGQPELKKVLSSERLRPLAQRIEMFYEIRALDRADTHAYLDRRVRIAGNPDGLFFESRAVDMIHECSGGIPRLINVLADRSLITAYVAESHRITEDTVVSAYEDLGEISQAVMPGSPRIGRHAVRRSRVRPVPGTGFRPPRSEPVRATHDPPELAPREPAPAVVQESEPPRPEPDPTPERPVPLRAGAPVASPVPAPMPEEAPAPPPVRLVDTPAASPAPGARVIADWEERRPEPKSGRAARSAVRSGPGERDRWLAGAGLAAITVLGAVSLGSRYLWEPPGPPRSAAAVPMAAGARAESSAVVSGPTRNGTAPVAPAVADPASETVASAEATAVPASPDRVWAIQVASFRTTDRANRLAVQLRRDTGEPVSVSAVNGESGIWYRVLVGEYATGEEVARRMEELRTTYDFGFLRRVRIPAAGERP
jgi:type II secretory pathway predicted ATPase ExeA/septal ring-binding cell division protein DamX